MFVLEDHGLLHVLVVLFQLFHLQMSMLNFNAVNSLNHHIPMMINKHQTHNEQLQSKLIKIFDLNGTAY